MPADGRRLRYIPLFLALRNQATPGRLCTRNHFQFSPCRSSHPRNLEQSWIISSIQHRATPEPLTVHQVSKTSRLLTVDLVRDLVAFLLNPQTGPGQEPGSVGKLLSLTETDQGTLRPGEGENINNNVLSLSVLTRSY